MKIYIEIGKVKNNGEDKPLVNCEVESDINAAAYWRDFKNKKQRLRIVQALLDLAYVIEKDTDENEVHHAG